MKISISKYKTEKILIFGSDFMQELLLQRMFLLFHEFPISTDKRKRPNTFIVAAMAFKPKKYASNIIFTLCTQNEQIIRINFTLKTFSSGFFFSARRYGCTGWEGMGYTTNSGCVFTFIYWRYVFQFSGYLIKVRAKLQIEMAFPHFVFIRFESSSFELI